MIMTSECTITTGYIENGDFYKTIGNMQYDQTVIVGKLLAGKGLHTKRD